MEQKYTVTKEHFASTVGSGSLNVLATPVMIAWMENVATAVVKNLLQEGETSVGTMISAEHLKASAEGEEITCKAKLIQRDGRKLSYEIECYNTQDEIIGRATHERFIVDENKFMSKLANKA